ncbi:transmembrane protein 192 [Willisornis vidua]|uniref:Transmembrane protein 192 n=1 Tax=Willisornis vidua TaxID=1566151 RepID=A0ABQ9CX28_9PASS|nr:transmembrane protein 192 [Willisornis vidua]
MALTAARRRQDLDNGSLEITQSLEDDPLLDAPLISSHTLHSHLRPRFHAIPAVLLANFLLLIHLLKGLVSLMNVQNFRLWPLDRALKMKNCLERNDKIGLHQGNTALLLILSVQHSFPDRSKVYLYLILGVLGLELISSLTCLVIYTVKISNFNRAKPRPDIIEEEKMYAYPSHITSEIGFRENSSLEEIVEKQGDVIEYLQRHNALLSKRLLALTSQQIKP